MAQGSSLPPDRRTANSRCQPTPHTNHRLSPHQKAASVFVCCCPLSSVFSGDSSVLCTCASLVLSSTSPQNPLKTLILPPKTKKSAFFCKNWFAKFLKGAILYPCCAWKGGTRLIIKFSFEACDKKSDLEKNQKKFKIRFASSKKRCYIMQPIFSGVLLKVPYGWLKIE